MKRALRVAVPLAVAVATVAAVLLVIKPWDEQEAIGGTIEYRLCDVTIPAPPGAFDIIPYTDGSVVALLVRSKDRSAVTDPATGQIDLHRSGISIDPASGNVISQTYATPAERAALERLLSLREVRTLKPASAPWPYTDTTQVPARREKAGPIEYRAPDPGAGFATGYMISDGPGFHTNSLVVMNCRSQMWIDVKTEPGAPVQVSVPTGDIHPDDRAAFEAFLREVSVSGAQPVLSDRGR